MAKRHARHPDAVVKERAGLAPESTLPKRGWQPDYGWYVVLYLADGQRCTRDYLPGTELALVRNETRLMLKQSPASTKAWIIMKTGRRNTR